MAEKATTRKRTGNYSASRFNRLAYGTHRDGPLPCRGYERCVYRFCEGANLPVSGSPCPYEVEHCRRFAEQVRQQWEKLSDLPNVDLEALIEEAVNIDLQRMRAITRMSDALQLQMYDLMSPKAVKESELADLYLDRLSRRQERLDAALMAAAQELIDRRQRTRLFALYGYCPGTPCNEHEIAPVPVE